MAKGQAWPKDRLEFLKRCVLEKKMPVSDCARALRCSEASIRSQLKTHGLPCNPHPFPEPDFEFFENYGLENPSEPKDI